MIDKNDELNISIKHWRNPYIVLLFLSLFQLCFFEIAPFFTSNCLFLHRALPALFLTDINFAVSAAGSLILYLCLISHKRWELWGVFICGSIIDAMIIAERLNFIGVYGQILHIGLGYFPFVIIALCCRVVYFWYNRRSSDVLYTLEVLALCFTMPVLYACGGLTTGGNGMTYDGMLMAADGMFGTQVSFLITRTVMSTLPGRLFNYAAYFYLAFFMICAQLICYKLERESNCGKSVKPTLIPAWLYIIVAVLGMGCYRYFPAVGTEYYCGTAIFPNGPIPDITVAPVAIQAPSFMPRNAMPSLHLSWILCAYFSICNLKKWYNYVGGFIVFCVLISAFAVGNHWLTDFIVALPFTAMCLGLASYGAAKKWRLWAFFFGGLCCFGLMSLYKYDISWVMTHRITYIVIVAVIDIVSWLLCLQLLPKSRVDLAVQQQ